MGTAARLGHVQIAEVEQRLEQRRRRVLPGGRALDDARRAVAADQLQRGTRQNGSGGGRTRREGTEGRRASEPRVARIASQGAADKPLLDTLPWPLRRARFRVSAQTCILLRFAAKAEIPLACLAAYEGGGDAVLRHNVHAQLLEAEALDGIKPLGLDDLLKKSEVERPRNTTGRRVGAKESARAQKRPRDACMATSAGSVNL